MVNVFYIILNDGKNYIALPMMTRIYESLASFTIHNSQFTIDTSPISPQSNKKRQSNNCRFS